MSKRLDKIYIIFVIVNNMLHRVIKYTLDQNYDEIIT